MTAQLWSANRYVTSRSQLTKWVYAFLCRRLSADDVIRGRCPQIMNKLWGIYSDFHGVEVGDIVVNATPSHFAFNWGKHTQSSEVVDTHVQRYDVVLPWCDICCALQCLPPDKRRHSRLSNTQSFFVENTPRGSPGTVDDEISVEITMQMIS